MIPEHITRYFCPTDYSDSDTGKGNGTTYFPTTGPAISEAKCPQDQLDLIYIDVVDTAGSGTNTYTVEASLDGGVTFFDVTNLWFGVANFTASFSKSPAFPVPVDDVHVKRVRSGDTLTDGGSAVRIRRRRWSI